MRGRKPTPTHLRLVRGNPGRRPINGNEPSLKDAIPAPPAELTEDARREWRRVAKQLKTAGLLTALDRAALSAYCTAVAQWREAERALARMAALDPVTKGMLVKTSNGNPIQNPMLGIANTARRDMVRFAAEFGMTPSARSRVHVDPSEAQKQAVSPARKYF